MSIGNLIQKAGFEIKYAKVTKFIQPPLANFDYKFFGLNGYKFLEGFTALQENVLLQSKELGFLVI